MLRGKIYQMSKILNVYKTIGWTPLQLIIKLRNERSEFSNLKIGFAGRLDPLAHGVMLLMLGDETKNRNKYLNLDKEYEFEVLFGAATDTFDSLGFLISKTFKPVPTDLEKQIKQFIKTKTGKQTQSYPPYSSKEVGGKPLYLWTRENKLSKIKIPEREIEIYKFELLKLNQIPADEIRKRIIENIKRVDGDFRQLETLEKWDKFFNANNTKTLTVAKFRIKCSSGTYVRSLANELGKTLNSAAIAIDILRTKVGEHDLKDSMRL